jgi:hypothetical protein
MPRGDKSAYTDKQKLCALGTSRSPTANAACRADPPLDGPGPQSMVDRGGKKSDRGEGGNGPERHPIRSDALIASLSPARGSPVHVQATMQERTDHRTARALAGRPGAPARPDDEVSGNRTPTCWSSRTTRTRRGSSTAPSDVTA